MILHPDYVLVQVLEQKLSDVIETPVNTLTQPVIKGQIIQSDVPYDINDAGFYLEAVRRGNVILFNQYSKDNYKVTETQFLVLVNNILGYENCS